MKYQEFFSITIAHNYFSGIPEDLVLVAENETKTRLNNLGYILKKTTSGIKILTLVAQDSDTFISLGEDDIFTFYVYPTSVRIQEVTDLSEIENGNMLSFSNQEGQIGSTEMISTQVEQNGVLCGFPALASIVIAGNKINTNSSAPSTNYEILFKAKSVQWKYYFVSNTDDSTITLESRDEQISFNEMVVDQNVSDQIITSLQLNFPNTRIRAFESRDSVPYSNQPIKNIKLIKNGDVLMSHLPNPKIQQQGIQIIKIK
ncbi:hypothetical protein [uncultured Aquimarina sp.]|uniref:hypothetical protein n=1 Tax=uncultured Aquimarina sp. TaxID=575652 RepID=UPI00262B5ED3|nr:hypothetical protein [uncultured Aquimarina sp.]